VLSGKTIWFTGLSASGKSALTGMLKIILESRGIPVVVLDGDILRKGLNSDLGFSTKDRVENIRRAGEVAKILCGEGHLVLSAFITPLEEIRKSLRQIFEPGQFVEIYLDCSLEICESRDPKGLYRRARNGEIPEFTGVSSPFEPPAAAELVVPTGKQTLEESLKMILSFLGSHFPDLSVGPAKSKVLPKKGKQKVAVIGLDGVPPSLVFGEISRNLPNMRALTEHGISGPLRSTNPPITVPAWATITTGKDPGELGIYGFRNRKKFDYEEMSIVTSSDVQAPRVWDYIEQTGRSSILLSIPQTYPPSPHNGITICGFPAPDGSVLTHPAEIRKDLANIAGGDYLPDIVGFRTDDKQGLLDNIYTMVQRRFRIASDFLIHKPWDFFMMVEMAPDRIHHGFWKYFAPDHRLFQAGNEYESVMSNFYVYLDSCLGSLLALLDDNTTVIVLSDHGARTSHGGICINEWLIKHGYLVLRSGPDSERRLSPEMIDWSRSRAWSDGGYYARIFINVQGREPQGIVSNSDYESLRNELIDCIAAIPDENGKPMENLIYKPEQIYQCCRNCPPDLLVYFDGLSRRSIGSVGTGTLHRSGNDTGPDDANHDPEGIFIAARMADLRKGRRIAKYIGDASCLDITPTILHEFGLSAPAEMTGKVINLDPKEGVINPEFSSLVPKTGNSADRYLKPSAGQGYTQEEEEIIKARLRDLGYI
jgi:adenylyl-sulfate kinase